MGEVFRARDTRLNRTVAIKDLQAARRITIVRFRPPDIRVINRRIRLWSCYLFWCLSAWLAQLNRSLDRVAPYQNMNFIPNCSIRGVQLSRPLPVEVILPNVAEETFRSGAAQKLTRLNVL